MNLLGIDLNLLLVLEAVYNEGNMGKAGERLNLSQPAVSNALRRLREKLDDPLFVRTSEGMVPTNFTITIQPTVTQALNSLRDCLTPDLNFDPAQTKNHYRISHSDVIGSILLPDLLTDLQVQAPDISFTFRHNDRVSAYELLRTGRLDLVLSSDLEGPGMYQQLLFEDEYVTVISKTHSSIGDELSLDQFCAARHVIYSLEGHGPSNVDTALARRSLKRQIAIRMSHVSIIPRIIETTDLIATLPRRIARPFLETYQLRLFETPIPVSNLRIYQYWHSRSHHDPACIWMRSMFSKLCKSD